MSAVGVSDRSAPARSRALPFTPRSAAMVAVALLAAVGGALWIALPKDRVSTDDAYLKADSTLVAPKVRGLVAAVLVRDNQRVRAGEPLIRIDPEEFDARVASAQADLEGARAGALSAAAALASLGDDERLAGANVHAAQTAIASADAQRARAAADRARFDKLADSGAVTGQEVDTARASALSAASDAERSRAALEVAHRQGGVVRARRPALLAAVAQAKAGTARAQAALRLALQDQGHATIFAPVDGVVGDRQANPGDYVQPGSRLLTLVPTQALYVVANFKETQVARMLEGQSAMVRVDALPGRRLAGHVESFAPGSGSQFSLLPYEPGTGNFTKIVQRVPVRIRLDPSPMLSHLRPGLSVSATVALAPAP